MANWDIRPGDVLLYRGSGIVGWVIRVKTWGPVSHVELANSASSSLASRDLQGVWTYPIDLDPERLWAILRPETPLDMQKVREFHARCLGQKYDLWGLLRFFSLGKPSLDKQFCSEYVTRLLRAGGLEPFTPDTDADLVAPRTFLMSPRLRVVWKREKN